jgi:hypothetical protein
VCLMVRLTEQRVMSLNGKMSTYDNVLNVRLSSIFFVYKLSSSEHNCCDSSSRLTHKLVCIWMNRFQGRHIGVGHKSTDICCSKGISGVAKECVCNCLICLQKITKLSQIYKNCDEILKFKWFA